MTKQLHIINGDDLAEHIHELKIEGEIVVWREMLCEGPTAADLGSKEFIELRTEFLKEKYQIPAEEYEDQFLKELKKLTFYNSYEEVVLWFEFDLFSHINMLAAISHLMENNLNVPVYLVCSKKLKGEKEQNVLSQLPLKSLQNHYDNRIPLKQEDLEMASLLWQLYNESNPQKLKKLIKEKTNFEYLSSCLRAHIERFPNTQTGLNSMELNILKIITTNKITSMNQLLGYSLEYQGYYGYGDRQMQRVLDKLQIFYKLGEDKIELTSEGKEAVEGTRNFYRILKNEEYLGGAKIYDFLYDVESHNILKL